MSDIGPSVPGSEIAPRDLARELPAWLRDRELWRRGAAAAAGMFAVLAAASLLLALAVTALVSGTHPGTWPSAMGGAGAEGDLSTAGLLRLWSALFLAAHQVPYTLSTRGGSASVAGVGPLLLTVLLVVLARRAGRRLELSRPAGDTPWVRAGRGLILSLPYWGLCLVVVLASRLGADDSGVFVGPSAAGLVNVELIVGGAAALGALTARTGLAWSSAVRSAVAGLYGMTVGLGVLLPVALVAAGIDAVTSSGLPSPASLSAPGIIGGAVCLVAYAPNLLGFVWGAASDLTVVGQGALVIVVIAPVAGALAGALVLRARPRFGERAAFAAAFAVATAMATSVSTPSVSSTDGTFGAGVSWSTGGSQLRVLLVATLVAATASVVSPYVPLRWIPLWPRFAGVAARVVGAVPTEAVPVAPLPLDRVRPGVGPESGGEPAPSLRLPRWAVIAGVVGLPTIVGLAIVNTILGDHYSAEATVRESLAARAAHDPARIVASTRYRGAGGGVSLTDRAALERMGRIPQHAVGVQNVQVLSVVYDGAGAHAAVSYQQNGVPQQESLDLVEEGRHLGLYPAWRVVIPAPSLEVELEVPRAGVSVAIDGYPVVADGQGVASVFVIPGVHRVRLAAEGPFSEDVETVDASTPAARVTLRSSLSATGRSAARRAVEGFFSGCAAATTLVPDHCPQWESNSTSTPSNVHWALRGDPLAATTWEVDSAGAVEASGSWAMDVAYDAPSCMFCDSSTPSRHLTDTQQGRYRAVLNWTGSAFTVTSVNGETVPSPVPATADGAGST